MIENKKIKLLIVPSDGQGVGHFRSIWPAQSISKYHGEDFDVEINLQPNVDNIEYLKQFDIIHFHRHFGPHEKMDEVFAKLRAEGVILIMDIDDFWEPPTTHPLFEIVRKENLTEKIKEVEWREHYLERSRDNNKKYRDKKKQEKIASGDYVEKKRGRPRKETGCIFESYVLETKDIKDD